MKITVIGSGYVGLVTGACFSNLGHQVTCIDVDVEKIRSLKNGMIPFYEPGLSELVQKSVQMGFLHFSSSYSCSIPESQITFICVGTPCQENGNVDLKYIDQAASEIASHIKAYQVIVVKSTTPVGTTDRIRQIILKNKHSCSFDIVSNPEFLREGCAIQDFMEPERVLVGSSSEKALSLLKEIYAPTLKNKEQLLIMDERSSELAKYAANAMLATRISFMNELALFCDKTGANIQSIQRVLGTDSRIGPQFLSSGLGYGGSCFPKDVRALIEAGKAKGANFKILKAVHEVNQAQPGVFIRKLEEHFEKKLKGKTITLLGLAFKPKTDDVREAPSLSLIRQLILHQAHVRAYDPVAEQNVRGIFGNQLDYFDNIYHALEGADALILCTEWDEFQDLDFVRIKKIMAGSAIFDGRNVLNGSELKKKEFQYYGIGLGKGDAFPL